VTKVIEGTVEAGQSWSPASGSTDFNDLTNAYIEVSSIPPINLSKQLDYLIQYPHGCIEQTTSGAFPQLYVDLIAPLSEVQKRNVEKNIKAAIARLQNFQVGSGGFSYWPGGGEVADWASSYAGHFLLEAKARGYAVPQQMLDQWLEYQSKTSRTWDPNNSNRDWYAHDVELSQAYRLYTLALGSKPDAAGMNRLREMKQKYETTASLLAAAFAISGKKEAAKELVDNVNNQKYAYDWWGNTYGSSLRDMALKLETFTALGENKRGLDAALQISQTIGTVGNWYSTQEIATCLRAIAKYAQKATLGDKSDFTLKVGNQETAVNATTPYYVKEITEQATNGLSVKNTSKQRLYVRAVYQGRPTMSNVVTESSNISMAIRYTDLKGQVIDPVKLTQGTDFLAEVTVTRTGTFRFHFNELALTQIFPSGWEIMNTRMNLVGGSNSDPMDYQDVRDDRVMTYFDLPFIQNGNKNDKQSRTYRIQLNAAYVGRYFLAPVACEAMYDNRIRAITPGRWIEVI
jgi:alpha-2-macroglobulin